jgi:hypothetical protein
VYLTGAASAYDLELEAQGTYVVRLEGRKHRPFELVRKLRGVVQSRQPDLVHSHLFHANVLVAKVLRSDPKIPLIHTAHIIEGRHRPLRPWFERRAALRASRVVCVSWMAGRQTGYRSQWDRYRSLLGCSRSGRDR